MMTPRLSALPALSALLLSTLIAACGSDSDPAQSGPDAGNNGSNGGADAGSSIDAPTSSGTDPADAGSYTFSSTDVQVPGSTNSRKVASTVFTPDGAPAGRPLVVISPGFSMAPTQYTSYAEHLASWGFVVILTDYDDYLPNNVNSANDIKAVITWALGQSNLMIDSGKIATAGHSLGGKLSVWAATLDSRIKAVVAWDPVDSGSTSVAPEKMTSMTTAIAVIGETTNGSSSGGFGSQACAPTADNFATYYAASPSPAMSVTVKGADHMDWVDDPSCLACSFCDPGTADEATVQKITRRIDVAWLRKQLLGDTSMDSWLSAPPEAANLTITSK